MNIKSTLFRGAFFRYFLPALFCSVIFSSAFAQKGESLFKGNCASCHTIGRGVAVGPDLKDVHTRHAEEWILKWVHSSQTMVKAGDAEAVKLFNDNNKMVMPDQPLTDAEIKEVLAYIKEYKPKAAVAATENTAAKHEDNLITMLSYPVYLMVMLSGLCLIVVWTLNILIKKLSHDLADKK